MPANYTQPGFGRKPFNGYALLASDDGTATVINLPCDSFGDSVTDNQSDVESIDATQALYFTIDGIRYGQISQGGSVAVDRGLDTLINNHWGPRNYDDNVAPLMATYKASGSDSAYTRNRVWYDTIVIAGRWAAQGQPAQIGYALENGVICDPDNLASVTALAKPTSSGKAGVNLSSFHTTGLTDGAADTPTDYRKGLRSFALTLQNGVYIVDANDPTYPQLSAGARVGILRGSLQLTQLRNAPVPIPLAKGAYPFNLILNSGDGTKKTTIALATRRDTSGSQQRLNDQNTISATYAIKGGFTSNGTDSWPVVATYADVS